MNRNRVLRAAIILDLVAVAAPILAYAALVLAFANEDFAPVAPALLIILVGAAVLAGPIALILGIIAFRWGKSGDRGGSIAVIVISAILTLLIVGRALVSLWIPIG